MRPLALGLAFIVLVFGLAACLNPKGVDAGQEFLNLAPEVQYVGNETCGTCHEELYASYATHGMAQSFYPLAEDNAVEDFSGVVVRHAASGFEYVAKREGGRFVQEERRVEPDGSVSHQLTRTMDYVVGSGSAARTYLSEENGRLYELPLTWYTRDDSGGASGVWALSPGYDQNNARFSRAIPDRCMACHNGTSEYVPYTDGKYASLASGIGCEQCHGPGELHVEARTAEEEAPDSMDVTIVNPKWLSTDLRLDVCQQCHLSGEVSVIREGQTATSYRPGMPLAAHRAIFSLTNTDPNEVSVISHSDRMKESACFQESVSMDCVTCHNPHEGFQDKGPEYFNSTCQTCHAPDALQGQMASGELKEQHAPEANCFSCHMPKVTAKDAPHASFTDHKIRVVRDDAISGVASGAESELVPYYERDEGDEALRGIAYIVFARQSGGSPAFRRGLAMLESALDEPTGAGEAQFLLGFARLQTGDARGAIQPLRAAIELQANPERLNTLAQALEVSGGSASEAEKLYRQALDIQPAASDIRTNLGRLLEAQGRIPDGIAQYRAAIQEEPWQVEAHTLLGGALAKAGDVQGAAQALREAIKLEPRQADALTNLAVLLAQQGQTGEAAALFRRAVQADPRNANAQANLALYLLNENDAQGALQSARTALQINPQQQTAQQVLGILQQNGIR
ncbi:tetratricopeptide repeat protein [Rubricoccus marinus]|uniref:Cytochrome c-552/4 domain-containing protein n=1 Tax=Rubricoccus marinus TaxID=716817 RepID=A0A259U1T0_9BACT|nr:tetratricopeptide repeat protein [Rubricoccus marinus]OZC03807.1 hypothetical protein BSZ36_12915 [Rubricoccus marinus]